jgi:hypothetical protein
MGKTSGSLLQFSMLPVGQAYLFPPNEQSRAIELITVLSNNIQFSLSIAPSELTGNVQFGSFDSAGAEENILDC